MAAIRDQMDAFAHSVVMSRQARGNAVADGKIQTAAMLSSFSRARTRMAVDLAITLSKHRHERVLAWHDQAVAISQMRHEYHRNRKASAHKLGKSLNEFTHRIQNEVFGLLMQARSARRTMARNTAQQLGNAVAAARHRTKDIQASTRRLITNLRDERQTMGEQTTQLVILRERRRHEDVTLMLENFRAFRRELGGDLDAVHRVWRGASSARSYALPTAHAQAEPPETLEADPVITPGAASSETSDRNATRRADVKKQMQGRKKHGR